MRPTLKGLPLLLRLSVLVGGGKGVPTVRGLSPFVFWPLIVLLLVGPSAPAFGAMPTVEARVDTARLTLGDPFRLFLIMRHEYSQKADVPSLQEVLADFSISDIKRADPIISEGIVEQVIEYELRSFQLGEQQIPPLEISFIDADATRLIRSTEPVDLEVLSVLQEGEQGPRDIKPPVAVPGGIPIWLAGMLAALAVVGIMAAIYWWLNRRQAPPVAAVAPPPINYEAEFKRIAGLGLVNKGQFKEHYSQLSELLRQFIEQYLKVDALEQTTSELRHALQDTDLPTPLVGALEHFLNEADLVKFARFQPLLENAHQAPAKGVDLVRSIKEHLKEMQRRALTVNAEAAVS